MTLPAELLFLDDVLANPKLKYSKSDWLLSDFPDPVWEYNFGFKKNKELNWDVLLDDGLSLLSPKHSDLLHAFKHWLIIGTTAKSGSGNLSNSLATQAGHFNQVIRYIDYFLFRSSDYQLSKAGLSSLTSDDLKHVLDKLAANKITNEALFEWSGCLSRYLKNLNETTDRSLLEVILQQHPEFYSIDPDQEDEKLLDIPLDDVPFIRAAIEHHGLYNERERGLVPNSVKISNQIYGNTIRLKNEAKHSLALLEIPRNSTRKRELKRIPVSTREVCEEMSSLHYRYFRDNLYAIGELHALNIPAPSVDDLIEIYHYQPAVNKLGRYRTLPSELVFTSVRNAIEFHINYGTELLDSYIKVAEHCVKNDLSPTAISSSDFVEIISPKLKELGVKKLGLTTKSPGMKPSTVRREAHTDHFNELRANAGFLELVTVYYGAIQLVAGALMARRQGELGDLIAGECLDESKEWLLFQNRKSTSGLFGLRNTEARPIEPIAVEMIEALESFQFSLIELSVVEKPCSVFSTPPVSGELKLSYSGKSTNHRNFDAFCDYFETPVNEKNERYYIRQHQLRRFFAMLFFYSSSFGGLETLQWMLGHTDRRHVWHYITETTDGPVLRGAKAQFITEYLYNNNDKNYKELSSLIKNRFGTDDFQLVDSNELEDYISSLLEEGEIEIEPEFFEDENGEQMRVMVKIFEDA